MKLNKFFMLGLASLAFTACSNNDEDLTSQESNQESKFRVTLSLGKTASGRSLGVSAAAQYNQIEKLEFVFFDGKGTNVGYPLKGELNGVQFDNEAMINNAVDQLNTKAKATIELKDIPGTAQTLLIVANNKQTGFKTSKLDAVRKSRIYLANQTTATGFKVFSGENSTLTGINTQFIENKQDEVITYSANVELRPVTSRIELGNIAAVNVPSTSEWTGPEIKKFEVVGYYVNNFFTDGVLDATTGDVDRNQVDQGSDVNKYTKSAYGDYYFMCDEPTQGQITYAAGEGNVIWKGTTNENKYWGYQVLKGKPVDIVVKLKVDFASKGDIEEQTGVTKFLTINRFKTSDDNLTLLEKMERGKVYKVNQIDFNVSNLTDAPYEVSKAISVNVTVLPWEGVNITPEFQ